MEFKMRNKLSAQLVSLMREDPFFSTADLTLLGFRFVPVEKLEGRIKFNVSHSDGGVAQVLADEAGIITRVFR